MMFEGRIGTIHHDDGSETDVIDGHLVSVRTKAPPSDKNDDYEYGIKKRRLATGFLLAVIAIMVMVDVAGFPHFRVEPGVYVGVEGKKAIDAVDGGPVKLIRLNHSTFTYAFEGIGWVLKSIGNMIGGEDNPAQSINQS